MFVHGNHSKCHGNHLIFKNVRSTHGGTGPLLKFAVFNFPSRVRLQMESKLAFEQIDGNFWYAAYGPFRVVMMKDTGYINATKLCRSRGKEYKDWIRLKGSYGLIQALQEIMVLENTHGTSAAMLR